MTTPLARRDRCRAIIACVVMVIVIIAITTITHCPEARAGDCTPLTDCTPATIANQQPCASTTPVVLHDPIPDLDVAGYALDYRESGGTFQKLADWPCWWDLDDAGVPTIRHCRAVDVGAPLQRYCPSCAPLKEYEFAVRAYDKAGNYSRTDSNVIVECMPLVMEFP